MAQEQPSSTRRGVLKTAAGAATAGSLAGCIGGKNSSGDDLAEVEERDESEDSGNDSSDSSGQGDQSKREQNIRNGIPLDGLGAYTDQMLEAGPARKTTTEKVNAILEGDSVEEERNSLVEALTQENYETLFSEYHRQKGINGNTENQVVLNRNWSFTSDSEPIFEFYLVENGELQSQPVILDPDPNFNNRQVNQPGSGEPPYLAGIRESTDWAQTVPQDWKALEDRIAPGSEQQKKNVRESYVNRWSHGLFGIGSTHDIIPHDRESSKVVFDGLYHNGDTQAVVELNNEYRESELFDKDTIISAEFTGNGWTFHEAPEYEMGEELPAHQ